MFPLDVFRAPTTLPPKPRKLDISSPIPYQPRVIASSPPRQLAAAAESSPALSGPSEAQLYAYAVMHELVPTVTPPRTERAHYQQTSDIKDLGSKTIPWSPHCIRQRRRTTSSSTWSSSTTLSCHDHHDYHQVHVHEHNVSQPHLAPTRSADPATMQHTPSPSSRPRAPQRHGSTSSSVPIGRHFTLVWKKVTKAVRTPPRHSFVPAGFELVLPREV